MATKYADLLLQLVGDSGDVNPPQVEVVFRRCLKRFMEKSQVWRTKFSTDLSAATPDPGTRATLMTAYQSTQAAANADPTNLTLAQAAADARAAAYAMPSFTLTRLVASTTPQTVYYTAIATALRIEYRCSNAFPYWKINAPTAATAEQTLEMLPPIAQLPSGAITARLYWTPLFDSDPALAVPDWVFQRYGEIVADWTIGELWTKGHGRKSDRQMGMAMSNAAMNDAIRIRSRVDAEDPVPIEM